jgi:exonuclease V gamma subunit
MLKNDLYVSRNKSIEEILKEKFSGQVISYATDRSKIIDVYSQSYKLLASLNMDTTTIILSAGGNDILFYYMVKHGDTTDTSILKSTLADYKLLIESIQKMLPKAKLYLLDIYYPISDQYQKYKPIIKEWNEMIYTYAKDQANNIKGVIKVSDVLKEKEDFASDIEPSSVGGQKISASILRTIS